MRRNDFRKATRTVGETVPTKRSPEISLKKRYADLLLLCELARLGFEYTDTVVGRRGLRPEFRHSAQLTQEQMAEMLKPERIPARPAWRWPAALDDKEQVALLAAFGQRLRRRFRPARSSADVATLRLSTGDYHFASVEQAYRAAGMVRSAFGAIALRNAVQSRGQGGEVHLLGDTNFADGRMVVESRAVRISPSGMIERANDFLGDVVLPAMYGREARRIRECRICTRPYVALRKDVGGCSPQCCNTRRQQKQREKWKANGKQYEQNRKKNREATDAAARRAKKQPAR